MITIKIAIRLRAKACCARKRDLRMIESGCRCEVSQAAAYLYAELVMRYDLPKLIEPYQGCKTLMVQYCTCCGRSEVVGRSGSEVVG